MSTLSLRAASRKHSEPPGGQAASTEASVPRKQMPLHQEGIRSCVRTETAQESPVQTGEGTSFDTVGSVSPHRLRPRLSTGLLCHHSSFFGLKPAPFPWDKEKFQGPLRSKGTLQGHAESAWLSQGPKHCPLKDPAEGQ